MSNAFVPMSENAYRILQSLADQTGQTMSEMLNRAVDAYRHATFFEKMNAGYAELKADPEALTEHENERKLWDATLMDGLANDRRWTEDGHCDSNT